jgi:DNA-binding response OmpR family regulator
MTSRVLIADDSLTIQKVIGITLANSGYDLVECLNESDLIKKIHENSFDLILLDFNLSDSKTGYELAKLVHLELPNAAIVVMLGTFDTVDEGQFAVSGISDKIVKPFESTKFIKKCRDLLEGNRPTVSSISSEISSENLYSKGDDVDQWRVDAPQVHSNDHDELLTDNVNHEDRALDPLSSEIEGWGFGPSHSLEEKFQKVFPPLIEESSEDVGVVERLHSSSRFIQDADSDEEKQDSEETQPSFHLPQELDRNILNTIDDDVSAESFWAVDEVIPKKSEEERDIGKTHLNEVTADLTSHVQAFRKHELPEEVVIRKEEKLELSSQVNLDELVDKLRLSLRPMLEEMVKDFCRQNAEKVAWEVIPDLAENLIRKEIKEISESIKH